jgi:integrase
MHWVLHWVLGGNVGRPLTEARIARLKHDPNGSTVQVHYDTAHAGLGVRLYASGAKSYVLKYGSEHGRKVVSLGSISEHTLSEAKEWWRQQREQERRGIDLVQSKKGARQEIIDKDTVAALIDNYVSDPAHLWSESHLRDSCRRGEVVKKEFGALLPEDLTPRHVRTLHQKITKRGSPVEANRQSTFIHSLFAWASEGGYLPETHPNPAFQRRSRRSKKARRNGGTGRNREHQRQRVLMPDEEEYSRLLRASDATTNPRDGAIVRLLLLTGLRTDELLLRLWSDVDWKQRVLHIPDEGEREDDRGDTKNGKRLVMPLCDRAIELLEGLRDPQVVPMPSTQIFVKQDGSGLKDWRTTWLKIRKMADLRDWGAPNAGFQVKDLRATVSTWLIEFRGYTDQQTGVLLNHSPTNASVTAQHYHSDLGRKLANMKVLVNELQEIMKTCEDGEEKKAFSTDGFELAVSSFSA